MELRRELLEFEMQASATQLRRLNLGWVANLLEANREAVLASLDADEAEDSSSDEGSSGLLRGEGDQPTMGDEASMSDISKLGIKAPEPTNVNAVAKKFDTDKPRYDLVPVYPTEAAAKVFAFGANKYGDRNWELGLQYGRLKAALMRHVEAFWKGEEIDPESGLPHLGHAMCCLMMLTEQTLNPNYDADELDDRPASSFPTT